MIGQVRRLVLAIAVAAAVAGCSDKQGVVQSGSGTDDFKQSPCACGPEIPQPGLEKYRQESDAQRA